MRDVCVAVKVLLSKVLRCAAMHAGVHQTAFLQRIRAACRWCCAAEFLPPSGDSLQPTGCCATRVNGPPVANEFAGVTTRAWRKTKCSLQVRSACSRRTSPEPAGRGSALAEVLPRIKRTHIPMCDQPPGSRRAAHHPPTALRGLPLPVVEHGRGAARAAHVTTPVNSPPSARPYRPRKRDFSIRPPAAMPRLALAAATLLALSLRQTVAAANATIVFQSGRAIADLNRTSGVYNSTWETSINTQVSERTACWCTRRGGVLVQLPPRFPLAAKRLLLLGAQYIDSWNYFNGGSYHWGQWNYTVATKPVGAVPPAACFQPPRQLHTRERHHP
jgi:hypothetical protein